jgi:hypothetical protein
MKQPHVNCFLMIFYVVNAGFLVMKETLPSPLLLIVCLSSLLSIIYLVNGGLFLLRPRLHHIWFRLHRLFNRNALRMHRLTWLCYVVSLLYSSQFIKLGISGDILLLIPTIIVLEHVYQRRHHMPVVPVAPMYWPFDYYPVDMLACPA